MFGFLIGMTYAGVAHGSCGEVTSGCNVTGTNEDNNLQGTSLEDIIYGYDGNDKIQSSEGDDFVIPGNGKDIISSGKGNDVIYLQEDSKIDMIICGDGEDIILVDHVSLQVESLDIFIDCEKVGTLSISSEIK
jgi:Ca2+-binding RTX toxin-like protein